MPKIWAGSSFLPEYEKATSQAHAATCPRPCCQPQSFQQPQQVGHRHIVRRRVPVRKSCHVGQAAVRSPPEEEGSFRRLLNRFSSAVGILCIRRILNTAGRGSYERREELSSDGGLFGIENCGSGTRKHAQPRCFGKRRWWTGDKVVKTGPDAGFNLLERFDDGALAN